MTAQCLLLFRDWTIVRRVSTSRSSPLRRKAVSCSRAATSRCASPRRNWPLWSTRTRPPASTSRSPSRTTPPKRSTRSRSLSSASRATSTGALTPLRSSLLRAPAATSARRSRSTSRSSSAASRSRCRSPRSRCRPPVGRALSWRPLSARRCLRSSSFACRFTSRWRSIASSICRSTSSASRDPCIRRCRSRPSPTRTRRKATPPTSTSPPR
jgi:hypothetical protein